MSFARRCVNIWLRLTEKPFLARVSKPETLRRVFEIKARLAFHPPRGTQFRRARISDVPVLWVNDAPGRPVLLYIHGGAFVMGSARAYRALVAQIAQRCGVSACVPDYRLAPEHPFPTALEDVLAVYRDLSTRPSGVIIGGDSAGGGLSLSLLAEIQRRGLPLPHGCFAFSPVTDLTFSGESVQRNAQSDVVLPAMRAQHTADLYLQGHPAQDPKASPLFADFSGGSPVWLAASDTEFLLDDTRRMATRLQEQGVQVHTQIAQDLPHVWPLFHNLLPEARHTLDQLAAWIKGLCPPADDS